jgi:hypothetical protein
MVPLHEPLNMSFAPTRWPAFRAVRQRVRLRLAVAVAASCLAVALRADEAATNYQTKADRLLTLAHFVEWPLGTIAGSEPLVIGVLGSEATAGVVMRHLSGRTVGARAVEVRRISLTDVSKETHILLVTEEAGITPVELRAALGNTPILLVGETEEFAQGGGAVALVSQGTRLQIALCPEHAKERGLKLSSRLFQVGRVVRAAPKT